MPPWAFSLLEREGLRLKTDPGASVHENKIVMGGAPLLAFRLFLSLFLLMMAGCLLWHTVFSNRVAVKDWEFLKSHPSARIFPEVVYWWGNYRYYRSLDTDGAIKEYREAVAMQPLLMDAWLDLAKAELDRGQGEAARSIASTIAPAIDHVSYWKWKELLLAFDLHDEDYFASTYNFILNRLHHRIGSANEVALRFWGSWSGILDHISPESRGVFLNELMTAKAVDESVALWKIMRNAPEAYDRKLLLSFCNFAIWNDRVKTAKDVWNVCLGGGDRIGVYDSGFEEQNMNTAFGWRISKNSLVDAARTERERHSGRYSFHVHFHGTDNVLFNNLAQVVPVNPGSKLQLSFARKSKSITTDEGVFMKVTGVRCKMTPVESNPVVGNSPWEVETLDLSVPDGCDALLLQLTRKKSFKFDSKISGDYWLDDVELRESN